MHCSLSHYKKINMLHSEQNEFDKLLDKFIKNEIKEETTIYNESLGVWTFCPIEYNIDKE